MGITEDKYLLNSCNDIILYLMDWGTLIAQADSTASPPSRALPPVQITPGSSRSPPSQPVARPQPVARKST
jgi:hypothetical protein